MSNRNKPTPIEPDSYTSNQGHVFNVGDAAIAVTCGTGNARLQHGKYIGVRYYSDYYSRKENPKGRPAVVMEVHKSKRRFVHEVTGEDYDWKGEIADFPYTDYSLARTNYEEYKRLSDERSRKVDERRKGYVWKDFPYIGRTMLQLNKIYPADIALRDVTL